MKKLIIASSLLGLSAVASQAATTFTNPDVDGSLPDGTTYLADGITMTLNATSGGSSTTIATEDAASGFWGVTGAGTDGTANNSTKVSRVGGGQTLSFSFDQGVILNGIQFNNLIGDGSGTAEIGNLTSSGSAFDGLTYTDITDAATGFAGSTFTTWGYNDATDSFALDLAGGNQPPMLTFGAGGTNSTITLAANEVVTFSVSGTFLAGGAGIRAIEVQAIPEPSSAALLGLGGLALILRRRK